MFLPISHLDYSPPGQVRSCPDGDLPGGELSWWGAFIVGNCHDGELSGWGVVLVGNCHGEELSW